MKWYNESRTKCLSLDNISYWSYTPKIKQNSEPTLCVIVGSSSEDLYFYNEEADEIYAILKPGKELL